MVENIFRPNRGVRNILIVGIVLILFATGTPVALASGGVTCSQIAKSMAAEAAATGDMGVMSQAQHLCQASCASIKSWFVFGAASLSKSQQGIQVRDRLAAYIFGGCSSGSSSGNGGSGGGVSDPCAQVYPATFFNPHDDGGLDCLSGKKLTKANFQGWNLWSSRNYRSSFPSASFSNANLTSSLFSGVDLSHADFRGALLTNASFINCKLVGANFIGVDLQGVEFTSSDLSGADLSLSNLDGIVTLDIKGSPKLPDGYKMNSVGKWLMGPSVVIGQGAIASSIKTINLQNADLSEMQFAKGFVSSGIVGSPKLPRGYILAAGQIIGPKVDLSTSDLSMADLSGVKSGQISGNPKLPVGWTLKSGFLLGPSADLTGVNLSKLGIKNIDLSRANLSNTTLTNLDLGSSDLSQALLSGVISGKVKGHPILPTGFGLIRGYLVGPGVNLNGADLRGASFSGISLSGTKLQKALLDNSSFSNSIPGPFLGKPVSKTTIFGHCDNGWFVIAAQVDTSSCTGQMGLPSLAGRDLHGTSFGGSIRGTNFKGANLMNARFTGKEIISANFDAANLTQAIFHVEDLMLVSFSGTNLSHSSFESFSIEYNTFNNSDLSYSTFTAQGPVSWSPNLMNSDLQHNSFIDSNLSYLDLKTDNFGLNTFVNSNLRSANIHPHFNWQNKVTNCDTSGITGAILGG